MRDLLLPGSILALALAIALHAITPANAQSEPAPTALQASCKAVGGNANTTEMRLNTMIGEGRTKFLATGEVICGW